MAGGSLKNQVDFPVLVDHQNARRVIVRQAKKRRREFSNSANRPG